MGVTNAIYFRVITFGVAQEYKHWKSLLQFVFSEV